jgi:hypothetical protein
MSFEQHTTALNILIAIENITFKLSKIDEDILDLTFNSIQTRNKFRKLNDLKEKSNSLRKEIEELKKEYEILFSNENYPNKIVLYKGDLLKMKYLKYKLCNFTFRNIKYFQMDIVEEKMLEARNILSQAISTREELEYIIYKSHEYDNNIQQYSREDLRKEKDIMSQLKVYDLSSYSVKYF